MVGEKKVPGKARERGKITKKKGNRRGGEERMEKGEGTERKRNQRAIEKEGRMDGEGGG